MGRDPLDDLREMGEAADLVGEAPPTSEEIRESIDAPVEEPSVGVEPDLVGGIEPDDGGEEEPVSVAELLGAKEAPMEQGEGEQTEGSSDPEPDPEELPSRRDARIQDLTDRLKASEERSEKMFEAMLAGKAPDAEGEPQEPGETDPELDPDVADYLKPYTRAEAKAMYGDKIERLDQMEEAMAPMRKQSADDALAKSIGRHVEGFKPEMLDAIQKEWDSMPEGDEKADFGMGTVGAAMLAQKMISDGKLKINGTTTKKPARLASRHNADLGGEAPGVGGSLSEDELLGKLDSMSASDVRSLVEQIENS